MSYKYGYNIWTMNSFSDIVSQLSKSSQPKTPQIYVGYNLGKTKNEKDSVSLTCNQLLPVHFP